MPIVEDRGHILKIEVTNRLLEFFNEHRIRTKDTKNEHRWQHGSLINVSARAHLHSYSMHLNGPHLMNEEAFSYCFSALNPHLSIGRYCSISWNVRIMGPQHPLGFVTSSEILYRTDGFFADAFYEEIPAASEGAWKFIRNPQLSSTSVGHDVWIGQDVLMKQGVSIGIGAVVAAGAVVTKNVAPYEIVGGVPAKHIRFRFDEKTIAGLLATEWWKYSIPQNQNLPWADPQEFIRALETREDVEPFLSDLGPIRDVIKMTD